MNTIKIYIIIYFFCASNCLCYKAQLMRCTEIIAVCSEDLTEQINALCKQNVKFFNVKPGCT